MPKPRKKESVVLGKLDKKTILVSSSNAFVLRERIKNKDGELPSVGMHGTRFAGHPWRND